MAVKTITIDMEAYDLLASRKKEGQSFSEVIKQELGGAMSARELRTALSSICLDPDTLKAVEKQVRRRRKSPARAPKL
jgi:predicted CopG family antitoxin